MNQNHGKGLFGFLAGITAGGLVALLTANRKGSDVRKDLAKEWSQGKPGTDTLKKELTGMAEGVRDIWDEVASTPQFKNAGKEVRKRFEETRTRAEELLADAEKKASTYKDDAFGRADELRKEAQKKATKLMNDAKAAIMQEEEKVTKTVKRATTKKAAPRKAASSKSTSTTKKK